jgi:uncharacterized membrane protein
MAEQIVRETRTVDATETPAQASSASVAARIVWVIFGTIIALLTLRFILLLLAANDDAAFVGAVYAISSIFAAPFFGIFSYQPTYGEFTFEISTVVAILVYTLLGWGIARIVTITRPRHDV